MKRKEQSNRTRITFRKHSTVFDNSLPISIVRKHRGIISVDSRKLITSVSSTWKNIYDISLRNLKLEKKWHMNKWMKKHREWQNKENKELQHFHQGALCNSIGPSHSVCVCVWMVSDYYLHQGTDDPQTSKPQVFERPWLTSSIEKRI